MLLLSSGFLHICFLLLRVACYLHAAFPLGALQIPFYHYMGGFLLACCSCHRGFADAFFAVTCVA